jgi:hypothetical protein
MNDESKKSEKPDPPIKRTQIVHELKADDFVLEQLEPRDIKRGAPKVKRKDEPEQQR